MGERRKEGRHCGRRPCCFSWLAASRLAPSGRGGMAACNGTGEDVKKIVTVLNEAEVPSEDVVGRCAEVLVSPTFVFLQQVKGLLRLDFAVAAQNCWVRKGGAFTSEISAEMLVNLHVPWVILGHSERRAMLGESSDGGCRTGMAKMTNAYDLPARQTRKIITNFDWS